MSERFKRSYIFLTDQVGSALSDLEADLDNASCGREELIRLGVALKEALLTAEDMANEDTPLEDLVKQEESSGTRP